MSVSKLLSISGRISKFVQLKGTRGWQNEWQNTLDASKVVSCDVRRRLFCIADRDKPYELSIKYKTPGYTTNVGPAFTFGHGGGIGASFYSQYDPDKTTQFNYRYESREKAMLDVNEIDRIKDKIDKLTKKIEKQINDELKNI